MSETVYNSSSRRPGPLTGLVARIVEWSGRKLLGTPEKGALTVIYPNMRSRTIGDSTSGLHAVLKLNNFKVLRETMRRGTVGFAAAYIHGDVDSPDLTALFRFFLQNQSTFTNANPGLFRRAAQDLAYHMSRANSREGARKNIAEHYDLGNDFYGEWLDPSMTYSSAIFVSGDLSLEQAQLEKYHHIADAAEVKKGSHVLEIGCGWGGLAETLARDYQAHTHGITLSREQLKYARERILKQGMQDLAEFEFIDYRDVQGTFDHVCSIEMIEAVGEEHWPTYFQTVHDRLKPGGTAAIQAISIDEVHFDDYRSGPDFIQRYIFPGGMLMTKTAMREQAERVGLVLENVETFALSYARTLRLWRERFLERWPVIAPLGYDEAFRRKWEYYLSYCEAGFTEGVIDVGIYKYRKPAG